MTDQDSLFPPQPVDLHNQNPEQPAPWKESLLALGPFILWPFFNILVWLASLLFELPLFPRSLLPVLTISLVFSPLLAFLVVLAVSVKRAFPRWTLPYWGLVGVFFLYLMTFSGTIAGQNFDGGWWIWLPVMLAAGVGAWLGFKSNRAGWRMQSTKNDWTSVTFVLYGILPAMLVLGYDEVHDNQLMILSSMLILAAGALFHMRSNHLWQRALSLVLGFCLSWGLAAINLTNYWSGRQEVWMDQAGDWWGTLLPMLNSGAIMLCILLLPWLFSLLRNLLSPSRRLDSA